MLRVQQVELVQQAVTTEEVQAVNKLGRENESALLLFEDVEVISSWENKFENAFMLKVRSSEGIEFQVQICPATDLFGTEFIRKKLNITGFGVQKDNAVLYDGGYYLLPRSQADVLWITETGVPAKSEEDKLLLSPNPARKYLLIHSEEKYLS